MHTTTASLLTVLAAATLVLASPAPGPAPPAPLITAHPVGPFPRGLFARQDAIPTTTSPSDESGDDAMTASCYDEYYNMALSMPTPNSQLGEWLSTAMSSITLDDPAVLSSTDQICNPASNTLTPPASLSSAWSRFQSASSSWIEAHASDVSSLQSACPGEISAFAGLFMMSDAAACTRAVVGVAEVLAPQTTAETDSPRATGAAGNGNGNGAGDGDGEAGKAGNDNAGEGEGDSEGQGAGAGAGNGNADGDNTPTPTESTAGVAAARETGLVAAVAAVAVGIAGVVAIL
jgi:hypothetical protein